MVHVDVGTQNLGAMLHNAARANAAVVILAGQTPVTANGEQPGGRDSVVHWMQDVPDQAGVVRPYVKSAISLATADTAARQVSRAFQLASSSPAGPVYLTAGRELLMQPAPAGPAGPPAARHAPAEPPAPAPGGLARAVAALASARRPVIVTARAGENPESVGELVALAELLGARVVDLQEPGQLSHRSPLLCPVHAASEGGHTGGGRAARGGLPGAVGAGGQRPGGRRDDYQHGRGPGPREHAGMVVPGRHQPAH